MRKWVCSCWRMGRLRENLINSGCIISDTPRNGKVWLSLSLHTLRHMKHSMSYEIHITQKIPNLVFLYHPELLQSSEEARSSSDANPDPHTQEKWGSLSFKLYANLPRIQIPDKLRTWNKVNQLLTYKCRSFSCSALHLALGKPTWYKNACFAW